MDSLEGMSDLFVKCWPEGCSPQETDTHWRCKKGKASFNWRILFDVELGPSTRAMKFPYFHLQLWDRDILKWNDCAGEGVIDLGKYYRKAFKRNVALKLFEKKKGLAAKRAAKKEKQSRELMFSGKFFVSSCEPLNWSSLCVTLCMSLLPPPFVPKKHNVTIILLCNNGFC